MFRTLLACLFWAVTLLVESSTAQIFAPRLFYTDLESGPKSGGENELGAYVTLYGNGFGTQAQQSAVTIGGGNVRIVSWSPTKIIVQLGREAASGDILVRTGQVVSNSLPFTVRDGNIYFVSVNGSDGASGKWQNPWRTVLKARAQVVAGDIVYVRNGVTQSQDDGEGWNSCFTIGAKSGAPGAPIAFVAYPNEQATIGDVSACSSGIRTKGQGEHYWTFAGFNLRGKNEAITTYGDHDWRVIANDMTCPNGDGASACYETSLSTYLFVYGNNVHDTGRQNASALYHGVYFSTDSNHVDFGWNTIANARGCRGLQVHSSPLMGGGAKDPTGHDQFDLKIHDNVIHDTQCDGIILATVDPSQGPVQIYNNVIYNAGKGPNNPERSGAWSCINVQGYTNNGPLGSGTIEVFNNTMYACGTFSPPPYEKSSGGVLMVGSNPNKKLRLRNNIVYLTNSVPYVLADDGSGRDCVNCPRVTGTNNVFFGNGSTAVSTQLEQSMFMDPLLKAPASYSFELSLGSLAGIVGTITPVATDFAGNPIPRCGVFPVGAFAAGILPDWLCFFSSLQGVRP